MTAVEISDLAMEGLRDKAMNSALWSGYLMIACSIGFGLFGFVPVAGHIRWNLTFFLLFVAVVFFVSGLAFLRIAKKKQTQKRA
jgi:hypothetical protein